MNFCGVLKTECTAEMFPSLCQIHAAPVAASWTRRKGALGPYWKQDFDVILFLGLTEVKAQITWWENVCRSSSHIGISPANVTRPFRVYNKG